MPSKKNCPAFVVPLLVFIVFGLKADAQPRVLVQINNDFSERYQSWKDADKYDFFLDKKDMKASVSKERLKITNSTIELRGIGIPGGQFSLADYKNGKISVTVKPAAGKYAGVLISRYRPLEATGKKYLEQYSRAFRYLINDKGSVTISTASNNVEKELYASVTASPSFVAGSPSRLTVERIGMTWNFSLNNTSIFSHTDNSNNAFENVKFITDAHSTAEFTEPSYAFYDVGSNEPNYRTTINGKLTYTDNVAGFMVIEDILKACPYFTNTGDIIKYQTKPCPEMVYTTSADYGEMAIGFTSSEYGKDDEQLLLALLKEANEKNDKSYTATKPASYDLTGDKKAIPVRYIDETYEVKGKPATSRYFYYYTRGGMLFVKITVRGNQAIADNMFYKACINSLVIKSL